MQYTRQGLVLVVIFMKLRLEQLGMTPSLYKKGGEGVYISHECADYLLGIAIVEATERGLLCRNWR